MVRENAQGIDSKCARASENHGALISELRIVEIVTSKEELLHTEMH